jgi:bifunctional non-homologous end joining protein LigD
MPEEASIANLAFALIPMYIGGMVIIPELLQDADDQIVARLLRDDNWVFQPKENGHRRIVTKELNRTITDTNRKGEPGQGLDAYVVQTLRTFPMPHFRLDVEYISTQKVIWVFDALSVMLTDAPEDLTIDPYRKRLQQAYAYFDNLAPYVRVVPTAWTPQQKYDLVKKLDAERAEGFVMKDLRARYRQGQRVNYRYKFTKTADVVVMGPSPEGHNSVRIGVYNDRGILQEVSGVSLNGKPQPQIGSVIQVKYLFASRNYKLNQPRMECLRPDKTPKECTIHQLIKNRDHEAA